MNDVRIVVYSKNHCPFCEKAKMILMNHGYSYEERKLEDDFDGIMNLFSSNGLQTFPQIFINDKLVGGCDDLEVLVKKGDNWLETFISQ
ncbi:MAG: glutaredoxin 3 [Candidatus Xenolissoclinum pacificiensis L6]|uniref:Glutaredoxin 1 n=1 Tax=Candidatus Xenolissoclinum pacificiensis L6 TaxID=1401685 RepID=W2UZF4_9RICK|nr:MAG: glutaredoxin 3 [Candidatus Xenolissoclinum pacificiensis L6]